MLANYKFKNIFSLAILGIASSLVGCSLNEHHHNNIAQAQEKPKVLASHNVICDLVETIAQDTIDLTCLIDPSQDPHTYRPTPSQRQAMEFAQVIFYGGYQLEPQITNLLEATKTPAPKIAVYEQAVTEPIMTQHEHSETDADHDHSETDADHAHSETKSGKQNLSPDPHVWHNLENTVAMVELIETTLLQLNPSSADIYLKNSTALTDQLWQLDGWIKDQIATIPQGKRILVTTHDSLNYYVQAYGIEDYQTLQGLSLASSPTASQVRELATTIKQTGVPTIFVESTANDRVIRNVADAANVQLSPQKLFVDGLGEADNFTDMMSHNTCAIVDGLGGQCQPFTNKINNQ
ncbi:Mn transporter MntC [Chondrocystis sp. NIES-4102]|nr:Mn transporter MntC [Chondrocystis sp. NIES-4102]